MFPELHTERFLLTKVTEADLPFLYEGLSDPEAMPHNGVYFTSLEETKKQLAWYNQNLSSGTGINWKVVSKATGEPVGVVSIYYFKPEHKKAELGYWLLPKFWRQGIAKEVLPVIIDHWFNVKGLHRLEAFVEEGNDASIALMNALGFVHEGTMRDCEIKFGKYISLRVYSFIR